MIKAVSSHNLLDPMRMTMPLFEVISTLLSRTWPTERLKKKKEFYRYVFIFESLFDVAIEQTGTSRTTSPNLARRGKPSSQPQLQALTKNAMALWLPNRFSYRPYRHLTST